MRSLPAAVQQVWDRHGHSVLRVAVPLMVVAAVVWLGYQFWRLLWDPNPTAAIDLKQRMTELRAWHAGEATYGELVTAVYPPASYVTLWPFLGWPSVSAARWIWAVTAAACLVWLVGILLREYRCEKPWERAFVVVLPLSMYATGATIGNGQLLVHVLPVLLAGLLLLRRPKTWARDVLCGGLIMAALVKPNATAPFFWIVLLVPGGFRAAILGALGYVGLTLLAASFQNATAAELLVDWFMQAETGVAWGNERGGYANQSQWLARIDLADWTTEASLAVLAGWGIWTYAHRRISLWILIGTTAVIARFWTYHPWYDDLLLLLPMFALFLITKRAPSPRLRVAAGILVGCSLASLLAPGGLYLLPTPWRTLYVAFQIATWSLMFILLVAHAWRLRKTAVNPQAKHASP